MAAKVSTPTSEARIKSIISSCIFLRMQPSVNWVKIVRVQNTQTRFAKDKLFISLAASAELPVYRFP